MASLTLDALLRGLKKGAPDPVYLLHGDEDVLKDEAVRALLDAAVDPAARDFNFDSRFAADLDAETFNALVTRRRCWRNGGRSCCAAWTSSASGSPSCGTNWCATWQPPT